MNSTTKVNLQLDKLCLVKDSFMYSSQGEVVCSVINCNSERGLLYEIYIKEFVLQCNQCITVDNGVAPFLDLSASDTCKA